ncbi:MAG: hypothetical protein ACOCRO_05865 [Halanaerobiales bacterium]
MSWYKKEENLTGMEMSVSQLKGVKYKDIIRIFGKPNGEIHRFEGNNIMNIATWKLKVFGTPIKVRIDSNEWARNNWKAKKYQIPSIKEDYIDEVEIIGEREFIENIVTPIVYTLSNIKVAQEDLRQAIQYIFTK